MDSTQVFSKPGAQKVGNAVRVFSRITTAKIEEKNCLIEYWITGIALLGLFLAVIESEICFKTCTFVENKCELTDPYADCPSGASLAMKGLVTCLTVAQIVLLWRYYRGAAPLKSIQNHVEYNRPLTETSLSKTDLLSTFMLEAALNALHPVPGISFVLSVEFKGITARYRIESILTLIMFLRLYHVWKAYRDRVFMQNTTKKFASLIHTTPVDSKFVVKAALQSYPILTISIVFFISIIFSAYWIKIAEAPVQEDFPSYFWNCCWFIVVTMTTTGYGDYTPFTHVGRVVAVSAMINGTILSAILTAAIYSHLSFNSQEYATMNFMSRAKWQFDRKDMASRLIANLWLHGPKSPRTIRCVRLSYKLRQNYIKWLQTEPHFGKLMKDVVNSTQGIEDNMGKVMARVKQLQQDSSELKKYEHDLLPPPGSKPVEEEEETKKETRSQKDLQVLLNELDSQKKLIEQLLRAVIFLSTSRTKDTTAVKSELEKVRDLIQKQL